MIQYSSLNDAWGIKKEVKKEQITHNITCDNFNHLLNCPNCINKLKQLLNKEQLLKKEHFETKTNAEVEKPIQKESIIDLIKNRISDFMSKDKEIKQLILLVLIFILVILLIQSFRKPTNIDLFQNKLMYDKYFIYPEEMVKIRKLLERNLY
jgi:hypothetical protein